jgi:hypothetical protein
VPAYWLVDPAEPSLTVLRLAEGRYVEEAKVTGDERYDASWPFPVSIVPSALLGARAARRHDGGAERIPKDLEQYRVAA